MEEEDEGVLTEGLERPGDERRVGGDDGEFGGGGCGELGKKTMAAVEMENRSGGGGDCFIKGRGAGRTLPLRHDATWAWRRLRECACASAQSGVERKELTGGPGMSAGGGEEGCGVVEARGLGWAGPTAERGGERARRAGPTGRKGRGQREKRNLSFSFYFLEFCKSFSKRI